MTTIRNLIKRLNTDERGLTTVEYVIVLCLIAALAVTAWGEFGDVVNTSLTKSSTTIQGELEKTP